MTVSIRFSADEPHQKAAIEAVVDLFEGQSHAPGPFEVRLGGPRRELFDELGLANTVELTEAQLLENLRRVQERQKLPVSQTLDGRHFSVEMETGTGKTYVYLRTAHELAQRYGLRKFIIVVPSVAIREGVLKSIALTRAHFDGLYGPAWGHSVYSADRLGDLRQFATSNRLELLILNIDAFNKATNVMNREQDGLSGRKPIEFLQATRPILIIDEPQNMESERAKAAIDLLRPTCTLRYSATHRNVYNLVHRLDPVAAYDQRLVKRIEVDAVLDAEDQNKPFVEVVDITATAAKVTAKLRVDVDTKTGAKRALKSVSKHGDDLFDLTKRDTYKGWVVDVIQRTDGYVRFTNGIRIKKGEKVGGYTEDVMRLQIRETVLEHLEKELKVASLPPERRLKVLSLFFIDRVANYDAENGRIRRWFVEAYEELRARPEYADLSLPTVDEVQGAYFASSKEKGKLVLKDTSGSTAADDEAYELIMRDKERLLSLDTPLRFIFSHSALREGWDNPNVFQICTLNETKSELKKRQEIGRGLRLPVDASGERSREEDIAVLTVITNESYQAFASALQREIQDDTGTDFGDRVKNKDDRKKVKPRPGYRDDPSFRLLFEALSSKTRYEVAVDRSRLVSEAVRLLRELPPLPAPEIVLQKHALSIDHEGVHTAMVQGDRRVALDTESPIPDLLGYLQQKTPLTRATLAEILEKSGRLGDAIQNPQLFLDRALDVIHRALRSQLLDGLKYVKTGQRWTVHELFEPKDDGVFEGYGKALVWVSKSTHEAVVVQSEVEREFAKNLESRKDVLFFVKLPSRFTVPTPLGTYNPDWGIVLDKGNGAVLALVVETKGTSDELKLRPAEWGKIQSAFLHFKELGLKYEVKTKAEEL